MLLLKIVGLWVFASLPLGIFCGRRLRACRRGRG